MNALAGIWLCVSVIIIACMLLLLVAWLENKIEVGRAPPKRPKPDFVPPAQGYKPNSKKEFDSNVTVVPKSGTGVVKK